MDMEEAGTVEHRRRTGIVLVAEFTARTEAVDITLSEDEGDAAELLLPPLPLRHRDTSLRAGEAVEPTEEEEEQTSVRDRGRRRFEHRTENLRSSFPSI